MDCSSESVVEITQPAAFTGLEVTERNWDKFFKWPKNCKEKDGWVKWSPSGGVKPYKFYFANRTSDTGSFEEADIQEFISGPPTVVDANNCSKTLIVPDGYWPGADLCKEETVPYLKEGSIALAAGFVIAIVAAIVYSCWSSKRQVPKNWKGGQK